MTALPGARPINGYQENSSRAKSGRTLRFAPQSKTERVGNASIVGGARRPDNTGALPRLAGHGWRWAQSRSFWINS
jgi:hypothetical protein